jgi:hypothetical protein
MKIMYTGQDIRYMNIHNIMTSSLLHQYPQKRLSNRVDITNRCYLQVGPQSGLTHRH